jgi:hypothetical protein
MPIEPALVRTDGDDDACAAEHEEDKLSDSTRNRTFGLRERMRGGSDVRQLAATLC